LKHDLFGKPVPTFPDHALAPHGLQAPPLCHNATAIDALLSFGTLWERTAPESAAGVRTPLFTARWRPQSNPAHHIQNGRDRPQQTADDKR
jgi:hypothetical protein